MKTTRQREYILRTKVISASSKSLRNRSIRTCTQTLYFDMWLLRIRSLLCEQDGSNDVVYEVRTSRRTCGIKMPLAPFPLRIFFGREICVDICVHTLLMYSYVPGTRCSWEIIFLNIRTKSLSRLYVYIGGGLSLRNSPQVKSWLIENLQVNIHSGVCQAGYKDGCTHLETHRKRQLYFGVNHEAITMPRNLRPEPAI